MVRLMNTVEVMVAEQLAVSSLKGGWATYENCYRVLADLHGAYVLGVQRAKAKGHEAAIAIGYTALINIFERMQRTKKVGATGDEIHALVALVDAANDFWSRRPAHELEDAVITLRKVRQHQMERKAA